jgi:hypothetical protein
VDKRHVEDTPHDCEGHPVIEVTGITFTGVIVAVIVGNALYVILTTITDAIVRGIFG